MIDPGPDDELEDAWDRVAKPSRDAAAELGFRFLRRGRSEYPRERCVFFTDHFVNIWDKSTCLELVGEALRRPPAPSIARVRKGQFATYVQLDQLEKIRTPMFAPAPPRPSYLGKPIVDAILSFLGRKYIDSILAIPGVEQVPLFDPTELVSRISRHRTRVESSGGRLLTFGDDPGASVDEWEARAVARRIPPYL